MFTYILVAVAIIGSQNVFAQLGRGMGPINLVLVHAKPCEGHKGYLDIHVVGLDDGSPGFDIDIDLPFPMDESISYEVVMDKVQNGQILHAVFRHGGDYACEDMDKFLGDLWKNMAKAAGAGTTCPVAPGKYHVEKYALKNEEVGVKTFLYGRFLMNIQLKKDGELLVCQVIEFTNSRPGESV